MPLAALLLVASIVVGVTSSTPAFAAGWTATEAQLPSSSGQQITFLSGDSCPSSAFCVAVGSYTVDGGNDSYGLIETLSGESWTPAQAPVPANATAVSGQVNTALVSVSCPSTTSCIAVGWYTDSSGNSEGLIDTLSGGQWSASEAPLPTNTNGYTGPGLSSISCPSVGSCVAVGFYGGGAGPGGFIDASSNGVWTATVQVATTLLSVSCASADFCAAVGPGANGGGSDLIETLSGGNWSSFAPTGADPTNVSCPVVGFCVVVGNNVEMLSNGMWSGVALPWPTNANANPEGGSYDGLGGISCLSSSYCVATGSYYAADGNDYPLIETLSGSTWDATEGPLPSNAATAPGTQGASLSSADALIGAEPNSVTCLALGDCLAVGTYFTGTGLYPLVESLSSGSWTATAPPVPSNNEGSGDGYLLAASCSPGICAAVGQYNDTNSNQDGLIESESTTKSCSANGADCITSGSGALATVASSFVFPVMTSGTATPKLRSKGRLPKGLAFTDNGNGTGVISGTPTVKTRGVYPRPAGGLYPFTIIATFGSGRTKQKATQDFTLTLDQAPTIISGSSRRARVGHLFHFTVKTVGYPTPTFTESGTLPAGVTFTDNGDGKATLSGTPSVAGTYPLTITASNGVGSQGVQSFTLVVRR